MSVTPAQLFQEHVQTWAELWKSGVEIEGEEEIEKTAMAGLYWLLQHYRADTYWSSSPGGIATNSYNGHVFWDTELWMFPPLLLWHPGIAKAALQYRLNTVPGARARAKLGNDPWRSGERALQGYSTNGVRFSWESAITGNEQTPPGFDTGAAEIHNTGDVAFEADQYYKLTRDLDFLNSGGYKDLIEGTGQFWSEYVRWEGAAARVLNVVPPDEEAGYQDDSIFTNAIAEENMRLAVYYMDLHDRRGKFRLDPAPDSATFREKFERTIAGLQKTYPTLYDKNRDAHYEYAG
ncbi:unnamed protein product [Amoebophrya sp. A120]|nr:unnamed protein product [Amoebophrya sp. A120]|eukprot:GSA120T00007128001.1